MLYANVICTTTRRQEEQQRDGFVIQYPGRSLLCCTYFDSASLKAAAGRLGDEQPQ